jgi:pimeloyl-ACP methyl ester carboxylesterase
VLDSPVSVDGLDGVERLPVLGAPRVLREACYPGACHRTVRDPQAALKAAAERLQRGALTGPLVAASGRVRTARVTEAHLFNALAETDTNPLLRARMPAAIASLASGDAAPLLHAAALTSGGGESGDFGVNGARLLATMCVEGQLPWAPDSPVAGRQAALQSYVSGLGPAPFAPFRPKTVLDNSAAGLCTAWPPTPAPQGVPSAGPDVPVLVISGRDDLRTPTEDARRTAAQFPHAQVLAVPGVGHSVLTSDPSGCALAGMTGFLAGKAAVPCSKRKPEPGSFTFQLPALPYVPARLDQLPASRDGRAGRTLNAFALTMQQLSYDALAGFEALLSGGGARIPGLRAGWWRFTLRRLELHGVEVIRGVRVTGTFLDDSKGASRFTISGPEAAAGTIVITRKGLTATLGGRNLAQDSL